MALMWASGTMNLSCFATGFLGWEFGLDLKQNILTVIFGTLLGSMVTVNAIDLFELPPWVAIIIWVKWLIVSCF